MDKGYTLTSNSTECVFKDGARVVAKGIRNTGLYRMLIKSKQRVAVSSANLAVKSEWIRIWHERFAHQNIAQTKMVLKRNGIDFIEEHNFQCEACVFGKHHRKSFKSHNEKTTQCGELIHSDVCGPFQVNSLGVSRYFLLMKDDYSHMRFVYFLKAKSEVSSKIKTFVEAVNNQTEH